MKIMSKSHNGAKERFVVIKLIIIPYFVFLLILGWNATWTCSWQVLDSPNYSNHCFPRKPLTPSGHDGFWHMNYQSTLVSWGEYWCRNGIVLSRFPEAHTLWPA